ncbi:unnamed protein product [Leptidea sinapis]|uniref:Uncharacterized protein n=1 Tax=Leptidea sinapis TaxID=189913 RepID=A0A5E4PNT5_9NEOP|nr:unnamed protein product [Leptidea sinapis]
MPPKKDCRISDSEGEMDSELVMLQAEREVSFQIVQNIYDLSQKSIDIDTAARERFLDESANIDELRNEFKQTLKKYNARLLYLTPSAEPDYSSLVAFESLYSRVKRLQTQYTVQSSVASCSNDNMNVIHKSRPKLVPIELPNFSVRALQNLKLENLSDLILVHIAYKRLDFETVRAFETQYGSESFDRFYSRFDNNIYFDFSPLVVDQITDLLPTAAIDQSVLSRISQLPLADESFGVPDKIDALIGASIYSHLFLSEIISAPRGSPGPSAFRTLLGTE